MFFKYSTYIKIFNNLTSKSVRSTLTSPGSIRVDPSFHVLGRLKGIVRYHCGGWPEEVNSCVLNSYMVYL